MRLEGEFKLMRIAFAEMSFHTDEGEILFQDVNFEFPRDSIVWLKGAGASGKSVLLKMLAGLLYPQEGYYYINDISVYDLSFEEFTPIRLNIGYGFDFGGLISNQTIQQNLVLPFMYHKILPPDLALQRVDQMINKLGLDKVRNQRPAHVSGGMKKATCVSKALIMQPKLLLLDEPTQGLSRDRAEIITQIILEGRKLGHFNEVVICSNDELFMEKLSPTIVEIREKKLVLRGELRKVEEYESQV